jgi:shikimate 5-dehydrogenase
LAGAAEMTVYNRSVERGQTMVRDLVSRTGANAHLAPWAKTYHVTPGVDILVNATSIGLFPDVDAMPDVSLVAARPDLLVCDVVPNPPETRLVQSARSQDLQVLTGLAMLVYQGAIGFEMWTGHTAPEVVMKAALAQAFGF